MIYKGVEYRDIEGFPGYRVGDDGSVWSRWKLRKLSVAGGFRSEISGDFKKLSPIFAKKTKYIAVALRAGGKTTRRYVHDLVLQAFVGPRPLTPKRHEACHGNGVRNDCRLGNLRWGTPSQNHADMKLHGTAQQGEKHGLHKLTDEIVLRIRREAPISNRLRFDERIANEVGVCPKTIGMARTGKSWRHL